MTISEVAQIFEAGGFVPDRVVHDGDDRFVLVFDPEPFTLILFCADHPRITFHSCDLEDGKAVLTVTIAPDPAMWGPEDAIDALERAEHDPILAAIQAEREAAWELLSQPEPEPGDVWDRAMAEIAADTLDDPQPCAACGRMIHRRSDAHLLRSGHLVCTECRW